MELSFSGCSMSSHLLDCHFEWWFIQKAIFRGYLETSKADKWVRDIPEHVKMQREKKMPVTTYLPFVTSLGPMREAEWAKMWPFYRQEEGSPRKWSAFPKVTQEHGESGFELVSPGSNSCIFSLIIIIAHTLLSIYSVRSSVVSAFHVLTHIPPHNTSTK